MGNSHAVTPDKDGISVPHEASSTARDILLDKALLEVLALFLHQRLPVYFSLNEIYYTIAFPVHNRLPTTHITT